MCALYRFESHMAANLDVLDSVTHEHTFDEYTLSKEKSRAFEWMAKDFRYCARNDLLSEKDRNSKLGRFFLRGEGVVQSVRDAYEAKLRGMWEARYRKAL